MRLLVLVEGQTEERFTTEVLRPHLVERGFHSVDPRLMGNARLRQGRGGGRSWSSVKHDIVTHLRQDQQRYVTTMVDFYALPQSGPKAWPGRAAPVQGEPSAMAESVEQALKEDIVSTMGRNFNPARFVPFVMMHEFEGLLFSDCEALCVAIGRAQLRLRFQAIRDSFPSPEHIDDSPTTAPSKRIQSLVPDYDKLLHGILIALEIGLDRIRRECPHFSRWLQTLESLPRR